jgi:O-antigen/teichoic acid export membrane protein
LIVWIRMLPLVLGIGAVLTWSAPLVIRVSTAHHAAVRWAMAVSVLAIAVDQVFALPGNVLRGLNLDYRATAARTWALLATLIFTTIALLAGGGLVGLATSSLVAVVLGGAAYLWVIVRSVPDLRPAAPLSGELQQFTSMTAWLFLSTLGMLLLNATDFMLVGYFLGPGASAVYAATGAVLRLSIDPVHSVIAAANPGMVGLCGRGEWDRIERLRVELHVLVLVATVVLGVGVVCLNASFLAMWLGPGLFGGTATNLLLVLLAIQMVPLRTDMAIIDGMAAYRERALIMCGGGAVTLLVGSLGLRLGGLPGMAVGTFVGRGVVILGLSSVMKRQSGIGPRAYFSVLARPFVVGTTLAVAGTWFPWHPRDVISFVFAAMLVGCFTLACMWRIGLDGTGRQIVRRRCEQLVASIGARS